MKELLKLGELNFQDITMYLQFVQSIYYLPLQRMAWK